MTKLLKFESLCWLVTFLALLFLIGPVAGLVFSADPAFLSQDIRSTEIWNSLYITIAAGLISSLLGLVVGIPLAYSLSRCRSWIRNVIEPLIEIPILLPPIIAGVSLVHFLSQSSPAGQVLARMGLRFISSVNGIVVGMFFVGVPFIVKTALAAFLSVDQKTVQTARVLGATEFRAFYTIILPMSARQIATGFILMLGRSVGIFGTVVLISYHPKTIPVLVYYRYLSFGMDAAKTPALLLIAISLGFFVLRRLTFERE